MFPKTATVRHEVMRLPRTSLPFCMSFGYNLFRGFRRHRASSSPAEARGAAQQGSRGAQCRLEVRRRRRKHRCSPMHRPTMPLPKHRRPPPLRRRARQRNWSFAGAHAKGCAQAWVPVLGADSSPLQLALSPRLRLALAAGERIIGRPKAMPRGAGKSK